MKTWLSTVRVAGWAGVFMLIPSKLWAQDAGPWIEVVSVVQAVVNSPVAGRLSGAGLAMGLVMFWIGEGRLKRAGAVVFFALGVMPMLARILM